MQAQRTDSGEHRGDDQRAGIIESQRLAIEHDRAEAALLFGDDELILVAPLHDVLPIQSLCLISQHILIRSEEHTSELQSLMRISYAVFCLKKKNTKTNHQPTNPMYTCTHRYTS